MCCSLSVRSFRFHLINRNSRVISSVLWRSIEIRIRQVRDLATLNTTASLESCDRIYLRDVDSWPETPLRWVEVRTCLESLIHLVYLCQLLLHANAVPYCFALYLCWRVALGDLTGMLVIMVSNLLQMGPQTISVKRGSHLAHLDWMDWLVVAWCDGFGRHWNDVCHSLMDSWVSSFVYPSLCSRIVATWAALVTIFNCLPALRSAVRCSK